MKVNFVLFTTLLVLLNLGTGGHLGFWNLLMFGRYCLFFCLYSFECEKMRFAFCLHVCGLQTCNMSMHRCNSVRGLVVCESYLLCDSTGVIYNWFLLFILQNVREQLAETLPGTGGGSSPNDSFLVKVLFMLPFCALVFCYYRSLLKVKLLTRMFRSESSTIFGSSHPFFYCVCRHVST